MDHWGAAHVPLRQMGAAPKLGTGSDMAGQSNGTALRRLWRFFGAHGALPQEVPYWSPQACEALGSADLYVHRSASVAPARCFQDDSLDLVYIDADHKWWSVLQAPRRRAFMSKLKINKIHAFQWLCLHTQAIFSFYVWLREDKKPWGLRI